MITALELYYDKVLHDCGILPLIPSGLREFSVISFYSEDGQQMRSLFRRPNSTLKIVKLVEDLEGPFSTVSESLQELQHIETLEFIGMQVNAGLQECLRLNKEHLTSLQLEIDTCNTELWLNISAMSNLSHLELTTAHLNVSLSQSTNGVLGTLKHLTLEVDNMHEGLKEMLHSLNTSHLQSFTYYGQDFENGTEIWHGMKGLKEL